MIRRLTGVFGLALAVSACVPATHTLTPTSAPAGSAPATRATETVHLGYSSAGAINGPFYIADNLGYFRDQGITVDFVNFPSASEVIPAITRGDVDVAAVGINPATLNALAGNFGIKLVADTATQYQGYPLNVMVVTKEMSNTINGPADLKGHKIALTPPGLGTASGLLLSKYLAQANLTPADVDIVPLTFPDQVAALTNRSVDVAMMSEPFATRVQKDGIGTLLTGTDKIAPDYQVTAMLYTDKFRTTRHDVAQAWMTAYLMGVRTYMAAFGGNQTNRDKMIQIMIQRSDIKDSQLWTQMMPAGASPDGKINLDSITESQQYFLKLGLVQNAPPVESLVDTSFAEAAVKQLGPGAAPVPPRYP